jgi:hypothetical protein
LKDLENNVLKLGEKMIPPSTSYTQSASDPAEEEDGDGTSTDEEPENKGETGEPVKTDIDEGGRPKKEEGEKADTTLQTEEARK